MTESHRGLYEKYFKPSLPDDVELVTKVIDAAGEGDYESKSWQAGVVEKLVFALEHVTMNKNGIFVLSDIDIQFFKHFKTEALLQDFEDSKCDILFQRESLQKESSAINTGFYIARCSKYVEELLRDSIKLCSEQDIANDQVALNQLVLAADRGKRWGLLPTTYFARSHGFPPSGNIVLHHANMTSTIQDKYKQMDNIRLYMEYGKFMKCKIILKEALRYAITGKLAKMLVRKAVRRLRPDC